MNPFYMWKVVEVGTEPMVSYQYNLLKLNLQDLTSSLLKTLLSSDHF